MKRTLAITLLCTFLGMLLPGCFTGVESTPKITQRDLRRRGVTTSPEKAMFDSVPPGQPPARWLPGKEFVVVSNRADIILEPRGSVDSLCGTTLRLKGITSRATITGGEEAVVEFTAPQGAVLQYPTGIELKRLASMPTLPIPFMVEQWLVDTVQSLLVGNTYYILPQRRLGHDGRDTTGTRYAPVQITAVNPGDANYPLRVEFTNNDGCIQSLMMTAGTSPGATRNFHTLFAFKDPRKQYPMITDKIWALIQASQVQLGMTPQECRLALGAPNDCLKVPSTAGMVEHWVYNGGKYLIFEDGQLIRYRP